VLKKLLKLWCAFLIAYEISNNRSAAPALKDFAEDLRKLAAAAKRVRDKWFGRDLQGTLAGQRIVSPISSVAELLAVIADDPSAFQEYREEPDIHLDFESPIVMRVQNLEDLREGLVRVAEGCDRAIGGIDRRFPDLGEGKPYRPAQPRRNQMILLFWEAGAEIREIMKVVRQLLGAEMKEKALREAIATAKKRRRGA
jgi:hypothetical protein